MYDDDYQEPELTEDDWEIETILSKRIRKAKDITSVATAEYYIKWLGYDDTFNEWKTKDELFDLGVPKFDTMIYQYEDQVRMWDKVKNRQKKTKPKTEIETKTKWDEALDKLNHVSKKHEKEERERARIERELADEARRVAQEAERLEEEERQVLARVRAERLTEKRRIQERKKFAALQKFYAPLPLPLLVLEEEKEVPKRVIKRSRVPSLWNLCIAFVCKNLELYEGWEHVPVIWKAKMFHYMSIRQELNAERFELLLDPIQDYLDLCICRTSVTIEFFNALVKAPLLTSLTLTLSSQVYFTWIKSLKECTNLRKLNLSGCNYINSLEGIADCGNLKELYISGCYRLCSANSDGANDILKLGQLEILDITQCRDIPMVMTLKILQNISSLKHLYANGAGQFTIQYLHSNESKFQSELDDTLTVPLNCRKLETLHWNAYNHHISDFLPLKYHFKCLDFIYESKLPIKDLEVGWINYDSKKFSEFISSHTLEKLRASLCIPEANSKPGNRNEKITDLRLIFPSTEFMNIPHLHLFFPRRQHRIRHWTKQNDYSKYDISNRIISQIALSNYPLRSLTLSGLEKMSVDNFINILRNQFFQLEELDLSHCGRSIGKGSWIEASDVSWPTVPFPRHIHLKKLALAYIPWINHTNCNYIISPHLFPNLSFLNIKGSLGISRNEFFQYLISSFPKLDTLITGWQTENDSFSNLLGGEKITELTVQVPTYSDIRWAEFFKSFPRLKKLRLSAITNEDLWLTDNFYVTLGLSRIKFLSLKRLTRFEKFGQHHAEISKLEIVRLEVTGYSGIETLIGSCQLIHAEMPRRTKLQSAFSFNK